MNKKRDYITAGAYYRLAKDLLAEACNHISGSLMLTKAESNKMFDVYNKLTHLETGIGFERKASEDHYGDGITDLFYGCVGICNTETDKAVSAKMKEILEGYISKLEVQK